MQKKYVAKLSKSGKAKQKAAIGKGQKAYAKGEKLSKDYFDDRQAIGGSSLDDEGEKEPGAVSSSTTAGNVLENMRTKINLGDKGEAGTGTVTVPKGTPTQQREYTDAVRRRQGSELQEKLDAQRKELQESFSFGSRKPGAGLVYQGPNYKEEGEVEDLPKAAPTAGDPSEAPTSESIGVKDGRTFSDMAEDFKKYQGDGPDEFAGLGPDGKPMYTRRPTDGGSNEPPPRPIGVPPEGTDIIEEAMDIYGKNAENYPKDAPIDEQQGFAVAASKQDYINSGYNTESPVAVQQINYGGRDGEVREYDEGERFFVAFDGNVIIRMKDREKNK